MHVVVMYFRPQALQCGVERTDVGPHQRPAARIINVVCVLQSRAEEHSGNLVLVGEGLPDPPQKRCPYVVHDDMAEICFQYFIVVLLEFFERKPRGGEQQVNVFL